MHLEAPLPLPRRNIWCVGRNYHEHAKELQGSVFKNNNSNPAVWPIVFTKVPECVVGPTGTMWSCRAPPSREQIDYEAELAVVIGTGGKNIARADAMKHVYGYTIVNDVTARDVQMRHQQWDMGKSFDTFCPMGPWIVTADELDGQHTRVRCWVNDELRQDGRTTDMIFDIPTLIETVLARHHTLSRRRDRHRHTRRRGTGYDAAHVPEKRRRGAHRDRRHRHRSRTASPDSQGQAAAPGPAAARRRWPPDQRQGDIHAHTAPHSARA
ncbi:MAG: fumarylacetoacetate hydrolase family protein [Agrobacterium sp.]|nr:fumarylacetoacetate hydrolase family protein [Agrobacterium sp.]